MNNSRKGILKELNEECSRWCISLLENKDVSVFKKRINFWLSSKLDEKEKEVRKKIVEEIMEMADNVRPNLLLNEIVNKI